MRYLTDLFNILIVGFHLRIESPGNLNVHEVLQVPLPTLSAIISFFSVAMPHSVLQPGIEPMAPAVKVQF